MNISEHKLEFTDVELASTIEIKYTGNENIFITLNEYNENKSENIKITISIPRHELEKFIEIINND